MTGAPTSRPRLRGRRRWLLLAVVVVLAVVGGAAWVRAGSTDPVPAAATTAAVATAGTTTASTSPVATTAPPIPTTTEATTEAATEALPPTTTPEATTPAPATVAEPAPAAAPPPAAPAAPGAEGEVLALVNSERATAGCGPVAADEGLAGVARAHSADMRDRGYFSHTSPEGLGPFDRADAAGVSGARAENIAQGYGDAASVMAGWMSSPGHRANILDCSLSRLGVGVAEGPGGPWWTQLFGS